MSNKKEKVGIDYERLGALHRGDNPFAKNGFFSNPPSMTLDEFGKGLDELKAKAKAMSGNQKELGKKNS